jgi:outer membrane immunogenic protein
MKKPVLASIAIGALSALAQPVSAADFPEFLRLSSPAGFSWTGLYLGAHGGYGWTKSQGLDAKGGFGGGQGGFNYQMGAFVLGLEGDSAWADISQTVNGGLLFGLPVSVTFQDDTLASLRARFGVTANKVLFYATGGGAWGHGKITGTAFGVTLSGDAWHSGWSAGGGAEWAFLPNVSAKIEYIHYGFDSATYSGLVNSGKIDVDTVKVGLNYLFR